MRMGTAGRMAFAMIAMVLLLLSIFSAALIAMVSKEASTEAVAVRELRMLVDGIDEARVDVENQAYDVALGAILDVVAGGVDERNLSAAFMDTVNQTLSVKFPRTYKDVRVSIDAHNITIQPLVMATRDIVPSPPSDSPENRWGINTTGELNVTSRIAYYKVAGILNVTATDVTAPTWRLAKAITLDREVAAPYPLLAAAARQVYFESTGGNGELGRVIKYILTTVAQYRVLAGYGVKNDPKNVTSILRTSDVEMAVNLAILLQQARLFRDVDDRSVDEFDAVNNNSYAADRQNAGAGDRSLRRLVTDYVTSGTVDPADLLALYIGLDGVPIDLERIVNLSASNSIRDMFVLEHLREYNAVRLFDSPVQDLFSNVFRTLQQASALLNLFEGLVKQIDASYPSLAGAARWAGGLTGDLVQQGELDARFSQSGDLLLLVGDDELTFPVNASATFRTAKIFSGRVDGCTSPPVPPVSCHYYYTTDTYTINSPFGSRVLRLDNQVATGLLDTGVWQDFYDTTINGIKWKEVGQEMLTELYDLLLRVGQEIAWRAAEGFRPEIMKFDPKDPSSVLESVYEAVHEALRGAVAWFQSIPGQQWLDQAMQNVVSATARLVLHLGDFLRGPIILPSCRIPVKVANYASGHDCLVDMEARMTEALGDRASRIVSGVDPDSSRVWSSDGNEVDGGNCTSPCGFDFSNRMAAEGAWQTAMKNEISNQVEWSIQTAYNDVRTGEIQSITTALGNFVGSAPAYVGVTNRLRDLVVGPDHSFGNATVQYIERSVDLAPLHDFLSVKILEVAELDQRFEFWLGDESDARDRGRVYREELEVRQDPPYLSIDRNNTVRSAEQARIRFGGQVPQNFTNGLGVYLDLLPEGRYNTEVSHADRMPFQNRWNVSILGVYSLNVSSVHRLVPSFVAPEIYYNLTIPIDLCFTIDPVTTWRLDVPYRDLFQYVKDLAEPEKKEWWESLFDFLDVLNIFSKDSRFDVREPVQAIAKHQIATSRVMISQLASGYVDAAVTKTMEAMTSRLTTGEILWTSRLVETSDTLTQWATDTKQPLSLSFPGFEVLARPMGPTGDGADTAPTGMAPWLSQVTAGLNADGYYGPKRALLRLDIIQGERTFCGDIENSHGFVTTWLVKKELGLQWITNESLREMFTGQIVAPLSYYAFDVRGAQIRFTYDPMRVQQYLWVAGQAKWTDQWGQAWGATVYLPNVEVFFSRGDSVDFDFPLIPGILNLKISFGYSLNTFPELDLAVPGQAFINEIGGTEAGTNQWVEIWHPWIPSPDTPTLFGNWKLVAARGGSVQSLSALGCTPGNLYYTVCHLPNRFFSPGKEGNPTNPMDSLMLLDAGGRIVDHTPFEEPCEVGDTFQRLIDGAHRWVCEEGSMGWPNWGTTLTQALDQVLGVIPGRLGGGLLGMFGFLGQLAQAYRNIGVFAAAILDLSIWFSIKFTILFVISIEFTFALSIDGDAIASVILWLMSSIDGIFHAVVSSSSSAVKAFPLDDLLSGLWISVEASLGVHTPDIPGAPEEKLGHAGAKCGYSWGWNLPRIMGWTNGPTAEEYWGTFCEVSVGGPLLAFAAELILPTVLSPRHFGDVDFGVRVWLFRLDKFALG